MVANTLPHPTSMVQSPIKTEKVLGSVEEYPKEDAYEALLVEEAKAHLPDVVKREETTPIKEDLVDNDPKDPKSREATKAVSGSNELLGVDELDFRHILEALRT